MSTTDEDFTEDQEESGADKWRKKLESRATTAEAELAQYKKRDAFSAVKGFNPEDPTHKFFAENYKGDVTGDAITEAFTANGFAPKVQETPEDPTLKDDLAAMQRMDAASNGAGSSATSLSPSEQAFERARKATSSKDFWAEARKSGLAT